MKRNVFIVTHLSSHDENCGYIEGIFDTEEDARAYAQTQIDKCRRKHKKDYGGRWCKWHGKVPENHIGEAEIRCGYGNYFTLHIESYSLKSKADVAMWQQDDRQRMKGLADMQTKQNVVFAVLKSDIFHANIDAVFNSEQLAVAYMQKHLEAMRAKHKRGYGGRWLTELDGSRTVMLRMYNQPYILLSLQRLTVQTKL